MESLLLAHLSFKKNVETKLKKYGLNSGNPKILTYIGDHEGCKQKDIADEFYMETCTLSSVLSNMEKSGLIKRIRPENDKRSYTIHLTNKGENILNNVRKQFNDSVKTALSGFSPEEAEAIRDYLDRIVNNLKEANTRLN